MKTLATSDLHGSLPIIPECDLLLIAGDICPNFSRNKQTDAFIQAGWINFHFANWLQDIPAKKVIACWGNHDFIGRYNSLISTYVLNRCSLTEHQNNLEYEGLKIHTNPYTKKFFDWEFMKNDSELEKIWETIPENLDICMVHGPFYGTGDSNGKELCGSKTLRNRIDIVKPKVFICGHIHEGVGKYQYNSTIVYNVAQTIMEIEI